MRKTFCDKCGKEITEDVELVFSHELCHKCAETVDIFITQDVEPVKQGTWEDERYDDDLLHCYIATCSECGYESTDRYHISESHKYCENCGVRMKQEIDIL